MKLKRFDAPRDLLMQLLKSAFASDTAWKSHGFVVDPTPPLDAFVALRVQAHALSVRTRGISFSPQRSRTDGGDRVRRSDAGHDVSESPTDDEKEIALRSRSS